MQSKYRRLNAQDKQRLNELWAVEGLSIKDMEPITGFTRKTIRTYFQKQFGLEALKARRSTVHSLSIVGDKHPQYKGGRKLHTDGYVYVLQPYGNRGSRYILEHRLVMNCPPDMIVHHCDGDKINNTESNLVVMTPEQHTLLHNIMGCSFWNKDKVLNWLDKH